ncbi:tumor protein p53-inducible nuclear protein 2 [Mugil cephalus]|uniref:tumor protein p53-inducible nuclear protein 2 n=1 Tax=Mugil cephalus TaxID=48193 RepID=UPI001FB85287|nr:tumor protein p53-inducible nuclear protein 2 [Mugil cephalus]
MFRTITRLLFGGEEETPEDVKSGEAVEEGWLVVNHQEADSAESKDALLTDAHPSNSALHGNTAASVEIVSTVDAEDRDQSSSSSTTSSQVISFPQPKAVAEIAQLACVQKAKAWADRQHVSRNAIQRQNRVHQGVQHHSFNLQQPGHRSLNH